MADPFLENNDLSHLDFLFERAGIKPSRREIERKAQLATVLTDEHVGRQVEDELTIQGESPTIDALKQERVRVEQEQTEGDIHEVLSSNLPFTEKRAILNEIPQIDEIKTPSLTQMALEFSALNAEKFTAQEEEIQLGVIEHFEQVLEYNKEVERLHASLDWEGGAARQVFDLVASAVLPGWQVNVTEVINATVPGLLEGSEHFWAGDAQKKWIDHLRTLDPLERLELMRKLVDNINKNNFWTSNNSFLKYDLMQMLIEDLDPENWEIVANNIFSVLDLVGFGLIRSSGRVGTKTLARMLHGKRVSRVVDFTVEGKQHTMIVEGRERTMDQILRKLEESVGTLYVRKSPRSLHSGADQVDPEQSRHMADIAMNDETGEAARMLDETRETITHDHVSWRLPGDTIRVTPDNNDPIMQVIDYDPSRAFAHPEELRRAEASLDHRLEAISHLSPNVHLNKTVIEQIDGGTTRGGKIIPGGYRARYMIGSTPLHGFSNLKVARDIAKTFKNFQESTARILARRWDTGEFVPLEEFQKAKKARKPEINPETGKPRAERAEYMIELTVDELVGARMAFEPSLDELENFDAITKGGKKGRLPVEFVDEEAPLWYDGKLAPWIDKSSVFLGWVSRAGNIAADAEAAKVKALEEVMRPMSSLKLKQQDEVLKVLDKGDRDEIWYTDDQLVDFWRERTDIRQLIEGYRSVVRHQQLVRRMMNDATRRRLVSDGFKWLKLFKGVEHGKSDYIGREVGRDALKYTSPGGKIHPIRRMWDAENGRPIDVDEEMLTRFNDTPGHQFIQLRRPVKHGNSEFEFVLIRPGSRNAKFSDLPQDVIRDIPGYIARVYDAPYMLKKFVKRQKDGYFEDAVPKTIRMYTNKGDALADLENMRLQEPDSTYEIFQSRELFEDVQYSNRMSIEYLEDSGQLFTGERGFEIKGIDGRRALRPVSDAILAGRTKAARAGTLDLLVDKLIRNWENRYGQRYGVNGRMPLANDELVPRDRNINQDDFAEAVALQRHIKMLAGIDDTFLTRAFRDMMIKISDMIVTPGHNTFINRLKASETAKATSAFLVRHRAWNPMNTAKGAAFTTFIIFNPIRQLFLQSQQLSVYLGIEHGWRYFLSRQGMGEFTSLIHGQLFRTTNQWGEWAAKSGAKAAGMSVEEYTRFVDAYLRSGLPASIDSHQYAMLSKLDRNLGSRNYAEGARDIYNNIRKVFRRYGFDAGEQIQIAGAFLAVRNKWMKNNPKIAHLWDQPDNLEFIAGQAREISFNMNKTGSMAFQKGGLGVMFQFLSHTTKALQVLWPSRLFGNTLGKLSNKAFSAKEKRRILLLQLGMYGTGGFGLNAAWEKIVAESGIDMDPEVNSAIQEGITGTLLNMSLRLLDDDVQDMTDPFTDIEFSSGFGTFSGIFGQRGIFGNPLGVMVDSMLMSDRSLAEVFLGPVYTLSKDVSEAMQFTAAVIGAEMISDLEGDAIDNAALILDEWGRQLLPFYNNFVRGRAERAMDRYISNSDKFGTEITSGEAWARSLLGTGTRRQRQVNDMLLEITGILGHPQREAITKELDDTAKQYYKYALRLAQDKADGKIDHAQALDILANNARALRLVLDPEEYDYIFNNRLRQHIYNDVTSDSTEAKLVKEIMRGYNNRVPDFYDPAFLQRLENMTNFESKNLAITWLEEIKWPN